MTTLDIFFEFLQNPVVIFFGGGILVNLLSYPFQKTSEWAWQHISERRRKSTNVNSLRDRNLVSALIMSHSLRTSVWFQAMHDLLWTVMILLAGLIVTTTFPPTPPDASVMERTFRLLPILFFSVAGLWRARRYFRSYTLLLRAEHHLNYKLDFKDYSLAESADFLRGIAQKEGVIFKEIEGDITSAGKNLDTLDGEVTP